MSHIEELSRDIKRLQPREPRDFAPAFERLAVTLRALHCLPGCFAFDQGFASGDAAGRHVGDETGMRVADFGAERICGDLEDTASDRLRGAVGGGVAVAAR